MPLRPVIEEEKVWLIRALIRLMACEYVVICNTICLDSPRLAEFIFFSGASY